MGIIPNGFRLVRGDNGAEVIASVTRRQLRRHGLASVSNDSIEHRDVLAVHHVNKQPGLQTVLTALKCFRELSFGALVPVRQAWDKAPWQKGKIIVCLCMLQKTRLKTVVRPT